MIDIKQFSFYKHLEFDTSLKGVFRIYLERFLPLCFMSFIGHFLLQLVIYKVGFYELLNLENQEEMFSTLHQSSDMLILISVTTVVIFGILNSSLINYIVRKDIDSNLSVLDVLINSFKRNVIHMIFFMIISIILMMGAMSIGIIVFVIGTFFAGLYMGSVLFPGGTLLVAEDKNAIEALGRILPLVHKNFWSNLGIFVAFLFIILFTTLALNSTLLFLFDSFFPNEMIMEKGLAGVLKDRNHELGIWIVIANSVVSALIYPLYASTSVMMYFKLRFQEDQKK